MARRNKFIPQPNPTPSLFVLDQPNSKLHFGTENALTLCGLSLKGATEYSVHLLREEAERGVCPECAIIYFSRDHAA